MSTHWASFSGPSSWSFCRLPSGIGCLESNGGTGAGARRLGAGRSFISGLPLTIVSARKRQQPRRPVAAALEPEQFRRVVDEIRRAAAGQELRMRHELNEKRNVHLHAANAELLQAALHAAGRIDKPPSARRHFHQQRIVIRRDHGSGEGRAGVEANAHAACRTVVRDPSVVGHEVVGGVFGGHAALHGEPGGSNGVLRPQADFRIGQRLALGDEDLATSQCRCRSPLR